MSQRKPIRSDIASSSPSTITVKGFDLRKDILGGMSPGNMAFLELTDRLPTANESVMFNTIAVKLVENGLTPSAIAARKLRDANPAPAKKADFDPLARRIVERFHDRKEAHVQRRHRNGNSGNFAID